MTNPTPQQIKQAREKAGLTQQQCADLAHVVVNAYKKWEYGDNKMSRGYWELMQIKILLGCPDDVITAIKKLQTDAKQKVKR